MNASDLATSLELIKRNFMLALASIHLLYTKDAATILLQGEAYFGPKGISIREAEDVPPGDEYRWRAPLDRLAGSIASPEHRETLCRYFLDYHVRGLVNDSFERVKEYASHNSRDEVLRKQHWYEFSRIIRNALVHDLTFRFTAGHRRILPVTWRGRTITAAMEGTPVTSAFFWCHEAYMLWQDFSQFATEEGGKLSIRGQRTVS